MKKIKNEILSLLLIILIVIPSLGLAVPQYTDKYVNDFAGIFNSAQINELRVLLNGIDRDTTAEVVVVSAELCEGGASQYAQEIFDSWKIGKKEKDNGLLILYCKQEGKIRVQTGYGLEGILPDSKLGRMLDDYYIPLKDAGNFTQGIILFTNKVSEVIYENRDEVLEGKAGGDGTGKETNSLWVIFVFIFVIWMIVIMRKIAGSSLMYSRGKNPPYQGIKSNNKFVVFNFFVSAVILAILAIFVNAILAVFVFFVVNIILSLLRGVRCNKDGLRMKKIGRKGEYERYKCPKGHIGAILVGAAVAAGVHHGIWAGGFGGGGFGGGGFGGGMSGGGGAGR